MPGQMFRKIARAVMFIMPPIFLLLLAISHADWSNDPLQNTPVCTAAGNQTHVFTVTDGMGGAILLWLDDRDGTEDIYAQSIGSDGNVRWTPNGIRVVDYDQSTPFAAVSTGTGALIAYVMKEANSLKYVYAQHVDAEGNLLWGEKGKRVSRSAYVSSAKIAVSTNQNYILGFRSTATLLFNFENMNKIGWLEKTPSRWEIKEDVTPVHSGQAYFLNVSDYEPPIPDRPGEYSLVDGKPVRDFNLSFLARSAENLTQNPDADYVIVFAYRDELNYSFVQVKQNQVKVRSIQNGVATGWLATFALNLTAQQFAEYHPVTVEQRNDTLDIKILTEQFHLYGTSFGGGMVGIGSWNDSALFDDVTLKSEPRLTQNAGCYAFQKIDQDGTPLWDLDTYLVKEKLPERFPMVSDYAGGVYVGWIEGQFKDFKIFTRRVMPNGVLSWDDDPIYVAPTDEHWLYDLFLMCAGPEEVVACWTLELMNYYPNFCKMTPDGDVLYIKQASGFLDYLRGVDATAHSDGHYEVLAETSEDYICIIIVTLENDDTITLNCVKGYLYWANMCDSEQLVNLGNLKSAPVWFHHDKNYSNINYANSFNTIMEDQEVFFTYGAKSTHAVAASFGGMIAGIVRNNDIFAQRINADGTLGDFVIPVELAGFSGMRTADGVQLQWQTASESNNYGFEIQRLLENSAGEWQSIGFVPGHGTSSSPREYAFIDMDLAGQQSIRYRLKQIDLDGTFAMSEEIEIVVPLIDTYALLQNYPNPCNPGTTIEYLLPTSGQVRLVIYDVLGHPVKYLINKHQQAGHSRIQWDGTDNADNPVAAGLYFCRMEAGDSIRVIKLAVVK